MLFKKIEKKIDTYQIMKDYFVEVSEDNDGIVDFYLYHKNYGIKELMFGVHKKDISDIRQLILDNAEDYILNYIESYIEE